MVYRYLQWQQNVLHGNGICAGAGLFMQSNHRPHPALRSTRRRFQGVQQDQRAGIPHHEMRQAADRVCTGSLMPLKAPLHYMSARSAHNMLLLTEVSYVSKHPFHKTKFKPKLNSPVP